MTPSQMLDACPPRITDFRHGNRDEMDMIMAKIREKCSHSALVMFRS